MNGSTHKAATRAEAAIREAAEKCLRHAGLILFGSRARGDAGRQSDFDLACLPRSGFSPMELLRFQEALEESPEVLHSVDVVNLEEVSPIMKKKILREGVVWKN